MNIDISKKDLWDLREALYLAYEHMMSTPNPIAFADTPRTTQKIIQKVNKALKKVHGHDCSGFYYLKNRGKVAPLSEEWDVLVRAEEEDA